MLLESGNIVYSFVIKTHVFSMYCIFLDKESTSHELIRHGKENISYLLPKNILGKCEKLP